MRRDSFRLAFLLSMVGALNWGLVGLFRFDLVKALFGRSKAAARTVYSVVGLAGLWVVASESVPRLMLAFGIRGERTEELPVGGNIVGRTMPTISGNTLNGERVTIPNDTMGRPTLLIMGFSYNSRFEVEDWQHAFQAQYGQYREIQFFVVPVIGGVFRLFGSAIDEGMRRGSPPEDYDHTLTLYIDVEPLRKAIGAGRRSDVWVYLLDRDGRVVFQESGPIDARKSQELASRVESTLPPARAVV